ncbi:hypothetical protein [Pseudoduganella violacea]|uniref:Uncharacterized protein n=1 Tax=Pseudoduganella violacea TaxID=1715466 RepID=A0A7W5BE05_9BURK|nr:hypothetical protein [Pseudoduganella violacea]MBB3121423.1 hypothetical protein [Pseudoduganella violacea]
MIKKFLSIFRNLSATKPQSDGSSSAHWLTKDDPKNPFVLEGFDCYGFVSSMISTTKDPDLARSFVALRSEDGQTLCNTLPEDSAEIPCSLAYAHAGEIRDGAIFKSSAMEEKWDIYLYDNRVYFCRSWAGTLAFVAELTPAENMFHISRVWASRSVEPTLAIRQVDYLVRSHLYKRHIPHPLPADMPRDPNVVALYSFSQYGRLCCFGSFEDTLSQTVLKSEV